MTLEPPSWFDIMLFLLVSKKHFEFSLDLLTYTYINIVRFTVYAFIRRRMYERKLTEMFSFFMIRVPNTYTLRVLILASNINSTSMHSVTLYCTVF